jgi:predicted nucleotidyltransferase
LRNTLLSTRIAEITTILKENKVKRAYAFGSICTDKFNDDSDVDLLISFEDDIDPISYGQNYFRIIESTERILNRKVDLVTERSLKNPYFIKVMNKTKTLIYE